MKVRLKLPSSKFSTLQVSSYLSWSMFKSTRPEVVIGGEFSMVPETSLWSGFWITLFGRRSDDPVIDLRDISTPGITTLSIAVEIALYTQFSTPVTAFSTSFLFLSAKIHSTTSSWQIPISTIVEFPKLSTKLPVWGFVVLFAFVFALVSISMMKSIENSFSWLGSFLFCFILDE